MPPSRPHPDVLRLPGVGPEPEPPADRTAEAPDPGPARRGRRRRAPAPAEDPRDAMLMQMLEHLRAIDARLDALTHHVQMTLVRNELNRRRLDRLDPPPEGRQEPRGAADAPPPGKSSAGAPPTP